MEKQFADLNLSQEDHDQIFVSEEYVVDLRLVT